MQKALIRIVKAVIFYRKILVSQLQFLGGYSMLNRFPRLTLS